MKKKRDRENKTILKSKNLIIIILGIIIIAAIIYFVFINEPAEGDSSIPENEANIIASFEWREPKTIAPYGGRFYDNCSGQNLGKIWADIELQNQKEDLSFTCKNTITVKDTRKIVESSQMSLGTDRTKSGFIGFTEELTKAHLIEICCKSKTEDVSFCQTFELTAYC